jgi:uncharacterized cupin superfamily protein
MKVVRSQEIPWSDALKQDSYSNRRKELGGGERLSCGLWELAPGMKSFPLHSHQITEEALFVISGRAKVRTQEGETAIGPGDFVAFPAGGLAHQLLNDGTEPLVYVGMSAGQGVDVIEYPDSDKVAAAVGKWPTGKRYMFRKKDQVEYLADEKDASAPGKT